jgi:hypothetical protein
MVSKARWSLPKDDGVFTPAKPAADHSVRGAGSRSLPFPENAPACISHRSYDNRVRPDPRGSPMGRPRLSIFGLFRHKNASALIWFGMGASWRNYCLALRRCCAAFSGSDREF